MALSDMAARNAKATGGKTWHYRCYWAGKQKRMSLSTYPEVGLRKARALRDAARALLANGINPRADRKQKRRPSGWPTSTPSRPCSTNGSSTAGLSSRRGSRVR